MAIRACSAPGCATRVTSAHVTCVSHWRELPKRVQKELQHRLNCWRDIDAAQDFIGGHYGNERARINEMVNRNPRNR